MATDTAQDSAPPGAAYRRPRIALAIAAVAYAVTVVLVVWYPGARLTWPIDAWALAILDAVVLSLPMIAAVWVAVRVASPGFAAAMGLSRWTAGDIVVGVSIGLIARAIVELIAPTAVGGAFGGGLDGGIGVAAVLVGFATAVIVSPVVEEFYFRGLIQRAMADYFGTRGVGVGIIVVAVSTVGFMVLHLLPAVAAGAALPIGTLIGTAAIGIGCGTLVYITGRLGGALVAHIVFNAIGVGMLLL